MFVVSEILKFSGTSLATASAIAAAYLDDMLWSCLSRP